MKARIEIVRRPEIADPEGVTVVRALHDLGFGEVTSARFDRVISLEVEGMSTEAVTARVEDMCRQLLANPVLEDFRVVIDP
ncbi:MAG TPA: phosphoribosylformylglycinamidine synthase subunit PurS [Acidimicrobiia bacterium]|jgi:phosphoribosylformylglycinamidine synthase|nr:phosphoribosylformylglycinamidine synthase subunit PurS [Acidimicrobiia bacterium]